MRIAGIQPNVQTYTAAIIVLAHSKQVPPSPSALTIHSLCLGHSSKISQQ